MNSIWTEENLLIELTPAVLNSTEEKSCWKKNPRRKWSLIW